MTVYGTNADNVIPLRRPSANHPTMRHREETGRVVLTAGQAEHIAALLKSLRAHAIQPKAIDRAVELLTPTTTKGKP